MELTRKPLQGVFNVVRFNWHYYVGFLVALAIAYPLLSLTPFAVQVIGYWALWSVSLNVMITLTVSWLIYDRSNLYSLTWLADVPSGSTLLNINAGFDETSELITQHYPSLSLEVCDFYDPEKHTELSIKRAREAYPLPPKTVSVSTDHLPFPDDHFDVCVAMLSAHEIRDKVERIQFFKELKRVLAAEGKIYVTEHQRDLANFLVYSRGAFHFHSPKAWKATFQEAGLTVVDKKKTTPFITTYALSHGELLEPKY